MFLSDREIYKNTDLYKFEVWEHHLRNIPVEAVTLVVVAVGCSCLIGKLARTLAYESFEFKEIILRILQLKKLLGLWWLLSALEQNAPGGKLSKFLKMGEGWF